MIARGAKKLPFFRGTEDAVQIIGEESVARERRYGPVVVDDDIN